MAQPPAPLFGRLPEAYVFLTCFYGNIEKKRGNLDFAHPTCSGSRIAFLSRISNAEAHALNNTQKGDINTMDVSHCFIVRKD